jgi:hypothetical protein
MLQRRGADPKCGPEIRCSHLPLARKLNCGIESQRASPAARGNMDDDNLTSHCQLR